MTTIVPNSITTHIPVKVKPCKTHAAGKLVRLTYRLTRTLGRSMEDSPFKLCMECGHLFFVPPVTQGNAPPAASENVRHLAPALRVACDDCGADVAEPCRTPTGKTRPSHASRLSSAPVERIIMRTSPCDVHPLNALIRLSHKGRGYKSEPSSYFVCSHCGWPIRQQLETIRAPQPDA